MHDDELSALWTLAVVVGLRIGELCALNWNDVDLERGTLAVSRTLTRDGNGKWIIGDVPKTNASRRTIVLPDVCHSALKQHRVQQLERRLLIGAWPDHALVFTQGNGQPFMYTSVVRARFIKLVEQINSMRPDDARLPILRPHDLRHTAATNMLIRGVPVHVAAQVLGHHDPGVLLTTYAHVLPSSQEEAARRMNGLYA